MRIAFRNILFAEGVEREMKVAVLGAIGKTGSLPLATVVRTSSASAHAVQVRIYPRTRPLVASSRA
jgi:hypothetical protein